MLGNTKLIYLAKNELDVLRISASGKFATFLFAFKDKNDEAYHNPMFLIYISSSTSCNVGSLLARFLHSQLYSF